jgi:hypothetical protein
MNLYQITIEVDGIDKTARWSGYTAQMAIAQCFLYEAQNGARSIKVIIIDRLY